MAYRGRARLDCRAAPRGCPHPTIANGAASAMRDPAPDRFACLHLIRNRSAEPRLSGHRKQPAGRRPGRQFSGSAAKVTPPSRDCCPMPGYTDTYGGITEAVRTAATRSAACDPARERQANRPDRRSTLRLPVWLCGRTTFLPPAGTAENPRGTADLPPTPAGERRTVSQLVRLKTIASDRF
jgi:hypothetical protein